MSAVFSTSDDIDPDDESLDIDLCSSSLLDGGDIGNSTRESSDMDKSSGDPVCKEYTYVTRRCTYA